jgi:hypothetical protein
MLLTDARDEANQVTATNICVDTALEALQTVTRDET